MSARYRDPHAETLDSFKRRKSLQEMNTMQRALEMQRRVRRSALPHPPARLLGHMLGYGNTDGSSIRPSTKTLARELGYRDTRPVRMLIARLCRLGILTPDRPRVQNMGDRRPISYRCNLWALEDEALLPLLEDEKRASDWARQARRQTDHDDPSTRIVAIRRPVVRPGDLDLANQQQHAIVAADEQEDFSDLSEAACEGGSRSAATSLLAEPAAVRTGAATIGATSLLAKPDAADRASTRGKPFPPCPPGGDPREWADCTTPQKREDYRRKLRDHLIAHPEDGQCPEGDDPEAWADTPLWARASRREWVQERLSQTQAQFAKATEQEAAHGYRF